MAVHRLVCSLALALGPWFGGEGCGGCNTGGGSVDVQQVAGAGGAVTAPCGSAGSATTTTTPPANLCSADSDCAGGAFCWLGSCVTVRAVAAGDAHTCALTSAGGVQCWGSNVGGALGNAMGSTTAPVTVTGLASGIVAIAAGSGHTCALTSSGSVLCWGYDGDGELGNDATKDSFVAVGVRGHSCGVAGIAAGESHTCALTLGGAVHCWGANLFGQLGAPGAGESSLVPVAVSGLSAGAAAISAGGAHTCALLIDGSVACWGATTSSRPDPPAPVPGLASDVAAIAAGGAHTCALTRSGGVVCWGGGQQGELGNGATADSDEPVPVTGLGAGVSSIAAGSRHTCALTGAGGVRCWGSNGNGQLGDGSTVDSDEPVAVTGLSAGATALAAGLDHTCAVLATGGVACWGNNASGKLGNGSEVQSLVPVSVSEP